MRRTGYKVVDQRTGDRVTSVTYFTEQGAWDDITSWQNRHDQGKRPDITRDMLVNMTVVPEERDRG